jgi:hypothetical protein
MFPLIRGTKCVIVMSSKPVKHESREDERSTRFFAPAKNTDASRDVERGERRAIVPALADNAPLLSHTRLVIRRIVSGQVIEITTASASHPHFPSAEFSDSFERNLDLADAAHRQIDGESSAPAESHGTALRTVAAPQHAGGRETTSDPTARRDLTSCFGTSFEGEKREVTYDSEGVAA